MPPLGSLPLLEGAELIIPRHGWGHLIGQPGEWDV